MAIIYFFSLVIFIFEYKKLISTPNFKKKVILKLFCHEKTYSKTICSLPLFSTVSYLPSISCTCFSPKKLEISCKSICSLKFECMIHFRWLSNACAVTESIHSHIFEIGKMNLESIYAEAFVWWTSSSLSSLPFENSFRLC